MVNYIENIGNLNNVTFHILNGYKKDLGNNNIRAAFYQVCCPNYAQEVEQN